MPPILYVLRSWGKEVKGATSTMPANPSNCRLELAMADGCEMAGISSDVGWVK